MNRTASRWPLALILTLLALACGGPGAPAQPPGKGGGGRGPGPEMRADQAVFHYLLEHHKSIRRSVKRLGDGVETVTESDDPEVAKKIQEHVASMHRRVKDGKGLRFWDELFVAVFKNHLKIAMTVEDTKRGVRVKETSADAFTVKLIQAHADVVTRFVERGFAEAHENHPVPAPPKQDPPGKGPGGAAGAGLVYPLVPGVGGVLALPKATDQPRRGAKVVFDVTAGAKPGEVNGGLVRAARLLNLYGAAGLSGGDVKVAVVLHGEATTAVLTDEAHRARFGGESNPNLPVLRDLQKAGVVVSVCGQALAYKKVPEAEVAPGIPVAAAALTLVINRQVEGHAYLPVP